MPKVSCRSPRRHCPSAMRSNKSFDAGTQRHCAAKRAGEYEYRVARANFYFATIRAARSGRVWRDRRVRTNIMSSVIASSPWPARSQFCPRLNPWGRAWNQKRRGCRALEV
jgi:hypothetical protein